MKEFNIFDQNHELIRLEKCQFCNFRKIDVLERLVFFLERH